MEQERTGDPYTESGAHAALQQRQHNRQSTLVSSLRDADALEQQGKVVIVRGRRGVWLASGVLVLLVLGTAALGRVVLGAFRAGPEGVSLGNWAMLGFMLALGALNFAWGWLLNQRRLGETGRRLIRRAEYQRAMATLQLKEAENERLR